MRLILSDKESKEYLKDSMEDVPGVSVSQIIFKDADTLQTLANINVIIELNIDDE